MAADDRETIEHTSVGDIKAGDVSIRQASTGAITAERATVEQSNVRSLETRSAQFDQSNVVKLTADQVVINQGAASYVNAREARLVKSNALYVHGDASAIEGDLKTVVFSGNATGNVHMIFDRAGALRFGAGLGAALVILGAIARKLFAR